MMLGMTCRLFRSIEYPDSQIHTPEGWIAPYLDGGGYFVHGSAVRTTELPLRQRRRMLVRCLHLIFIPLFAPMYCDAYYCNNTSWSTNPQYVQGP
jgi:hypothetical protein